MYIFSLFKTGLHFLLQGERYWRKYGLHLRGIKKKKGISVPVYIHIAGPDICISITTLKNSSVWESTQYTHCTRELPGIGDAQGNQYEFSLITSICTLYITFSIFLSVSPTDAL